MGTIKRKLVNERFLRFFALATLISLIIAAWFVSGYEPKLNIKNQFLAPLAFTPKGDVLSTATLLQDGMYLKKYVNPIRFLSTVDGTEVEPSLSTLVDPLVEKLGIPQQILHAEFSPDGSLLAVIQEHLNLKDSFKDEVELVVFVRKTRERIMSLVIPYSMYGYPQLSSAADKRRTLPRRLFSPDGKWLVCVEHRFPECAVRVWDIATKEEVYAIPEACYPVFSPDSLMLATTPYLGHHDEPFPVQLYEASSGVLRQTLALQGNRTGWSPWTSFSPDGRLIAVNSYNTRGVQFVEVFETHTGNRVFQQDASSAHLLADGKTLISVKNTDVQLWNTETWELKAKSGFMLGRHWSNGDELSPETVTVPGKPLVIVSEKYPDSTMPFQFQYLTKPYLRWFGKELSLNALGSSKVALIDGTSGRRQSIVLRQSFYLSSVVFSSDGSKAAISDCFDGSLTIWEIPPGKSAAAVLWTAILGIAVIGLFLAYRSLRHRTSRSLKKEAG